MSFAEATAGDEDAETGVALIHFPLAFMHDRFPS